MRPPGHYVDSRIVRQNLPKKLAMKVGRKTIIRRVAKRGFTAQKKLSKTDYDERQCKKRIAWSRKYQGKTAADIKARILAVGDLKEFAYYQPDLQPRCKKLRASRHI